MTDTIDLRTADGAHYALQMFYDFDRVSAATFDIRHPDAVARLLGALVTYHGSHGRSYGLEFTTDTEGRPAVPDGIVVADAARVALSVLRIVDASSPAGRVV